MRQGMVTGVGLQGPGLLIPTRGPTQGAINLAPMHINLRKDGKKQLHLTS
jgi:hypothetical protein